ncbi:MAG: hypothetical protein R3F37_11175 [Candidatus Competibacteraceae bacterium]
MMESALATRDYGETDYPLLTLQLKRQLFNSIPSYAQQALKP